VASKLRDESGDGVGRISTLTARVGATIERFLGMDKELDYGRIPPYKFQHLENTRITEEWILSVRGGETQASETVMNGPIDGIWEASDVGAKPEQQELDPFTLGVIYHAGAATNDPLAGRTWLRTEGIWFTDYDANAHLQLKGTGFYTALYKDPETPYVYAGEYVHYTDGTPEELWLCRFSEGFTPDRLVQIPIAPIWNEAAGEGHNVWITSITRVGDSIYVGVKGDADYAYTTYFGPDPQPIYNARVYQFDGEATLTMVHEVVPDLPNGQHLSVSMMNFGTGMLVQYSDKQMLADPALGVLYFTMDAAGVWAASTTGTAQIRSIPHSYAEYDGVLYWGGGRDSIGSSVGNITAFDGVTVAFVRSMSGTSPGPVTGMLVRNGTLYVYWARPISAIKSVTYLGSFDGVTWTDQLEAVTGPSSRFSAGMEALGPLAFAFGTTYGSAAVTCYWKHINDFGDAAAWTAIPGAVTVNGAGPWSKTKAEEE
jgi:hypothetical protein